MNFPPAFRSLAKAVELAIANDNYAERLNLQRWAETYGCTSEAVKDEFERQLSVKSLTPRNAYDVEGK